VTSCSAPDAEGAATVVLLAMPVPASDHCRRAHRGKRSMEDRPVRLVTISLMR
jgi:hypothetical protein